MPTPGERQALGFLVFIALSGASVRVWRANRPAETPSVAALDHQLARVDSAQRAPKRPRKAAPSRRDSVARPAVPVDLDRATALEIETLPGIGPALASRIVAHRDSAGGFGSLDALCEVRGVGAALAKRLTPLVTFSAPSRPVSATCDGGSKPSRKTRRPRTTKAR
jgi:DNA uptake protein ComE-like DNA-binding protein